MAEMPEEALPHESYWGGAGGARTLTLLELQCGAELGMEHSHTHTLETKQVRSSRLWSSRRQLFLRLLICTDPVGWDPTHSEPMKPN